MLPPPLPVEPWDEWLNHRQRSLRICFTSNSFFPDTDILLWVWRWRRRYVESPKTWRAEKRRALVSVLPDYNMPLLFRYCLPNIMTTPSSFCCSSVVLLVEMKSSPLQLLFLCWDYYPPSNSPALSSSLSFPPELLLFLLAAAAAVPLEPS